MPCDDCSRAEQCPPCVNDPQGSDDSSSELFAPGAEAYYRKVLGLDKPKLHCTCGHLKADHHPRLPWQDSPSCIGNRNLCRCQVFVCDHSTCGWKPKYYDKQGNPLPKEPDQGEQWRKDNATGLWSRVEPPLTPEEEERLAAKYAAAQAEHEGCETCTGMLAGWCRACGRRVPDGEQPACVHRLGDLDGRECSCPSGCGCCKVEPPPPPPEEEEGLDCLFCNTGASRIAMENSTCYARYDNFPASAGHVEIVPKRHVESFFGLTAAEVNDAYSLINAVREALDAEHRPDGYTIGINEGRAAGRTIDHLHIHLIPRHHGDVPDPRGGIRRALPSGDPDEWTEEELAVEAAEAARDALEDDWAAEAPPQPERRPPYAVAYSADGHLYEVMLPGDAIVSAVDGALVIKHARFQIHGIVAVQPIESKEG